MNINQDIKETIRLSALDNLAARAGISREQVDSAKKMLTISNQDSLYFICNQKYELCDARLKEVEPKWYENKWLYLLIGAFSVKSIDEAFDKLD